jgi:hypothetical protein
MNSEFSGTTGPDESTSYDTSHISEATTTVPSAVEDVAPKLSSNAECLLGVLSNTDGDWVSMGFLMAIGEVLGNRWLMDERRDGLLLAMKEIRDDPLVERLGGSEDGPIRIIPGNTFRPMSKYSNEGKWHDMGCRMLFVGLGLTHGLTNLQIHVEACVESAREITCKDEETMTEHDLGILSVGLYALWKALDKYGDRDVGKEMGYQSLGYGLKQLEVSRKATGK